MTFQMANTCCFLYKLKKNYVKNMDQPDSTRNPNDPTRPTHFAMSINIYHKTSPSF